MLSTSHKPLFDIKEYQPINNFNTMSKQELAQFIVKTTNLDRINQIIKIQKGGKSKTRKYKRHKRKKTRRKN